MLIEPADHLDLLRLAVRIHARKYGERDPDRYLGHAYERLCECCVDWRPWLARGKTFDTYALGEILRYLAREARMDEEGLVYRCEDTGRRRPNGAKRYRVRLARPVEPITGGDEVEGSAAADEPRRPAWIWSCCFTPREREIARLLANGLVVAEVATALGVSRQLVWSELSRIRERAVKAGLVPRSWRYKAGRDPPRRRP